MTTGLPFDDFRALIANLAPPDDKAADAAAQRLARAGGGLGWLGEVAIWLSAWSGRFPASVTRPQMAVFAGNHGVAAHAISPRPVSATAAMVEHCAAGGAAVNQFCLANDVGLKVYDLALHLPTGDITREAALDERGCAATMAFGMEATAGGMDLLCIGAIGVGNSTVAAALLAALHGGRGADWVGPGSGADAAMMARKAAAVDAALAFHRGHLKDPLEILRRVGGREFAAIAGAILAARAQKIPVVLDGLAATAAASMLHAANADAVAHCVLAAAPVDAGHRRAVDILGLLPLLEVGADLEAGASGALAAGLLKAAALGLAGIQPLPDIRH